MTLAARITWTTAQLVTAANLNEQIRDNMNETAPAKVTTAGDIVVATGANALKRLAMGTALQVPRVNAGGTDLEYSSLADKIDKAGDTMTGPLTLSGAPTDDLHSATKLYVDGIWGYVTRGTLFTVPNNAWTAVTLSDATTGMRGMTWATDTFTVPVTGLYLITAHIKFTANTTGVRGLKVVKNGISAVVSYQQVAEASGETFLQMITTDWLTTADEITLEAYQTSGGDLDIPASAPWPQFAVALQGR